MTAITGPRTRQSVRATVLSMIVVVAIAAAALAWSLTRSDSLPSHRANLTGVNDVPLVCHAGEFC